MIGTLKAGDKVRLVEDVYSASVQPEYPVAPGTVGVVVQVIEGSAWPLEVDFNAPNGETYPCDPSELEKVTE